MGKLYTVYITDQIHSAALQLLHVFAEMDKLQNLYFCYN